MSFDTTWLRSLARRPELLTPQEMAQADAASPGLGVSGPVLMANAGRAVARAVQARFRPCRTLVLCGPGNNGGDGYIAARLLAQQGWPVVVAALAPPRAGSDAAWAAAHWHGPTSPFAPAEASRADLVIDAVFGAGLTRDVDGAAADTLRASHRVVAVDVPSGLDGATGAIRGFAPQADVTVTFFRLKPGHLLLPGREHCGEIVLADIGLPVGALDRVRPTTFANLPELWPLPRLHPEAHKYSRGHVTVLGSATMTGAARLAADAARRAGAGMVTIAARGGGDVYRSGSPGLLVNEAPLAELLEDSRRQVWVCGPGLGVDAAREALPALIAARRTVVADADAFSAFAGDPDAFRGAAVLTPHAGEFARVFGPASDGRLAGDRPPTGDRPPAGDGQPVGDRPPTGDREAAGDSPSAGDRRPAADRLAAARAAAARTGAVVLLKGADTIVAAPDGRAAINASAPPWLATAGAGDVLAGIIAGLLGQGMPAWEAAAAGAWLHGEAAALAGPGMLAEDLSPALTRAFAATMNPSKFAATRLSSDRRKGVRI